MKLLTPIICFLVFGANAALGQTKIHGLPAGALVIETRAIETRALPARKQTNRLLVLWMLNPKKVPSTYGSEAPIPCPDQTRGSYYSGPTRVSLVNATTRTIINTVRVADATYKDNEALANEDGIFDLPYAIRKGYYYQVNARVKRTVEAKPTIMWLRDYNGDGQALEFALFDAPACMGLQTTLIGYSERRDRVVHYPINLDVSEAGKQSHRSLFWADYLFNKKPLRPGYWKYEVDYTGRGGTRDKWEVRYNAEQERFVGKLIIEQGTE